MELIVLAWAVPTVVMLAAAGLYFRWLDRKLRKGSTPLK
jgi:hypothetical protein